VEFWETIPGVDEGSGSEAVIADDPGIELSSVDVSGASIPSDVVDVLGSSVPLGGADVNASVGFGLRSVDAISEPWIVGSESESEIGIAAASWIPAAPKKRRRREMCIILRKMNWKRSYLDQPRGVECYRNLPVSLT
jgi:hypothetical protein